MHCLLTATFYVEFGVLCHLDAGKTSIVSCHYCPTTGPCSTLARNPDKDYTLTGKSATTLGVENKTELLAV